MREPRIGIWGPTGSGKTSYLAALLLEMQKHDSLYDTMLISSTAVNFGVNISSQLNEGYFPRGTDARNPAVHYEIRFEHKYETWKDRIQHRNKTYIVDFLDGAGRFIGDDTLDHAVEYFAHLISCNGILLMIDPELASGERNFGFPGGSYLSTLQILIHHLPKDSRHKIMTNLAFCITKSDLDDRWRNFGQYWVEPQLPIECLEAVLDKQAFGIISSGCDLKKKVAVFSTSVVGRYTTPGGDNRPNIVSLGDDVEIIEKKNRKVQHVVEPLLWLFKQIDADQLGTITPGRTHDFDNLKNKSD